MQINNLNKTINLIILGAGVILNFFVIDILVNSSNLLIKLQDIIGDAKLPQSSTVYAVISICFIIFIGLIVESISRHMINFVNNKVLKSIFFIKLFRAKNEQRKFYYWQQKLRNTLADSEDLKNREIETGATIFFEKAKDASINWVTGHFVTYLLAAGFSLIVFIDLVIFIWMGKIMLLGVTLVLFWALVSHALDKFYYAYSFLYRFSYLFLTNQIAAQQAQPEISKQNNEIEIQEE